MHIGYNDKIGVTLSEKQIFTEGYYITDMAAAKGGNSRVADVVKNWIRNRMTLELLFEYFCQCLHHVPYINRL